MNKKIISLVLALVMVLGTFTSVFAETAPKAKAKEELFSASGSLFDPDVVKAFIDVLD